MARLTVEEVKAFIKSEKSDYDLIIGQLIDYAYAYFGSFANYNPTAGEFSEFMRGKNGLISPAGMARDIVIKKILVNGSEIDLTGIIQVDSNRWKLPEGVCQEHTPVIIFYSSLSIETILRKIALDIITYEFRRSPLSENLINRLSKSIDGIASENFIGAEMFYNQINRELRQLFYVGI